MASLRRSTFWGKSNGTNAFSPLFPLSIQERIMKTVYSVCGMCGTRCPVAVGVENGEAVWIQGNPHSATGSTLCPRGIAALALEKDSERPQSPLMRVGARGGHKWRAVPLGRSARCRSRQAPRHTGSIRPRKRHVLASRGRPVYWISTKPSHAASVRLISTAQRHLHPQRGSGLRIRFGAGSRTPRH